MDADRNASPEQLVTLPSGIELCFQTFGDPEATPLLLVMGLGGPMTWWPVDLCRRLVDEGFFVIRYDNRDTGRSTRLNQHRVTRGQLVRAFLGRRGRTVALHAARHGRGRARRSSTTSASRRRTSPASRWAA